MARDSAGRIYLLSLATGPAGTRSVRLSVGPPTAREWADFSDLGGSAAAIGSGQSLLSAGIVIDRANRLHLAWTAEDGISGYAQRDLSSPVGSDSPAWVDPVSGRPGSLILARRASLIGDIALGPRGETWIAWTTTEAGHHSQIFLGRVAGGRWRSFPVAAGYGFAPPTLMIDAASRFHVAWHDIYDDCRILSAPTEVLGTAFSLRSTSIPGGAGSRGQGDGGYRPVVTVTAGRLLLVRENWQNRLQSAWPEEDASRLGPVTQNDARFAWDTVDSPQFSVDRYGIPWLFFIDGARQTAFYTRWLGSGWGAFGTAGKVAWNTPRMEDTHLPIDRISVEARQPAGRGDIGLLVESEGPRPAAYFRRISVPTLAAEPGRKILFLDLEEIGALDGLSLALNHPTKVGEVLGPGRRGEPDADHLGPPVRVLKQNGRYRMWYAGAAKVDNSDHWWEWYHALYAESADGRNFSRVRLGLVPYRGQADTNLLPGLERAHAVTAICEDPLDPRSERRYKFLRFSLSETFSDDARAGRIDPWTDRIAGQLLTSGDGLHWQAEPATLDFPAGRPLMGFVPQSLLVDRQEPDPAKRYKAYGFSALDKPRRCGFYAYSADGRHWTASRQNPVLDPMAGATPPVHGGLVQQMHDTIVWQEAGYYLALYQYQHDGVFLDLRLAVSRDGENFTFIHPEQAFLPSGPAGDWDSDQINPSAPLFDDGEIKFYYGAVHFAGGVESTEAKTYGGVGLATLRPDGYTDLELAPGRRIGTVTTIPIQPGRASRLVLNAEADAGGIEAEAVSVATGQPFPGYARGDCLPLEGEALARRVAWKGHRDLSGLSGPFLIRLYLSGNGKSPKLYSVTFR